MSGRHAQRGHRRRFWSRVVAAVVAVGMLAVGAFVLLDYLGRDDPDEPAPAACESQVTVTVAAEPRIAEVLTEIAASEAGAAVLEDGSCVSIEVTAASSVAMAGGLERDDAPDLWVPESSTWLARVSGEDVAVGEPVRLAVSPLVVVAPKAFARESLSWPNTQLSWSDMLSGEVAATIADPTSTTEGLATLLAIQAAVGDAAEDRTRLVEAMTAVSRAAVSNVDDAYALVLETSTPPLFTATEQSVVAHNKEHPEDLVVAVYPTEGTMVFDYPLVPVESDATTQASRDAVAKVVELFQAEPAVAALRDAGFRGPDGAPRTSAGVVDGIQAQMPASLPNPDPTAASSALRQWAALSLDMRMLAVIDVSGSMWDSEEGEPPPIEVVRDANLAALQLIPPTSDLGLWVFSTDEDPPNHWREVVELGPLTEDLEGGTRLEVLVEETIALPDSEERGWTALYDTAWAAFREVKEGYDPNRVNSVVLLSDGADARAPEMEPGMDLETLLSQLQAQNDPARPVLIITIGIGPEADMEALERISAATGASAYQALDPADLPQIFFQAMVERQCRPNC